MNKDFEYDLKDLYRPLNEYLKEHPKMTFLEFDYQTGNNITLFLSSSNSVDVDDVTLVLNSILKTMPSIKRIFQKPFIHLVEHDSIVPIEACRTIDNKTITYLSMHSETWQDIKDGEVLPRKLLTRIYKDNYSIYENIVFAYTINQILNYIRKNIHLMKDLLDNSQSIEINYLEKLDHIQYYLALAKLHTSYIRNYNKDAQKVLALLDKLLDVNSFLTSRLHRPVYKKNYKKTKHLVLKSTNILNMQRDYHQVYKLARFFKQEKLDQKETFILDDEFEKFYYNYTLSLIIFSVSNFSFISDNDSIIDYQNVDINFSFGIYKLNIKKENKYNGFVLTFTSDKKYQMLLIPYQNKSYEKKSEIEKEEKSYDDIYFLSPFYDRDYKNIYLSINNLNSFRRVQQLLLKGMIYSSIKFEVCPFCGEKLVKEKDGYLCKHCFTKIIKKHCDIKNEDYYETTIFKFNPTHNEEDKNIDLESYLHYRNITPLAKIDEFICPCCNKVHKN